MGAKPFSVTESEEDGKLTIFVKGRIDGSSADGLLEKLENSVKNGHKYIILNMYDVDFLSSVGIRVILKTFKDAQKAGGKFFIERPSQIVKNIMGMAALNDMILK